MAKRRLIISEKQLPDFGGTGTEEGTLTISTPGLYSNIDMTGFKALKVNCAAGDITIDGIVAKSENSIIHIFREVTANNLTLLNESGSSSSAGNKLWISPKYSKKIYIYNSESFIYQSGYWVPLGQSGFLEGNDSPEDYSSTYNGYLLYLNTAGASGSKVDFVIPNILKRSTSVSGTSTTFNSMTFDVAGDFIQVAYSGAVTINGISDISAKLESGALIKRIVIVNTGAGIITINHESVSAASTARFNLVGGIPLIIPSGGYKEFLYFQGKYRDEYINPGSVIIQESGTFTPQLVTRLSDSAYTTVGASGTYYRQGDVIFFNLTFTGIETVSSSGILQIKGMPFPADAIYSFNINISAFVNSSYTQELVGVIGAGVYSDPGVIEFHNSHSNTSVGGITFTNGTLRVTGSYLKT